MRLLPPKRDPWRFVREPDGRFAIYSNLILQYTQTGLTEGAAFETCRREFGLTPAAAAAKIQSALDNPDFWYDVSRLQKREDKTSWIDLQRRHYQSTPASLKCLAFAARNEKLRELHEQAADVSQRDWYAHAVQEGFRIQPNDPLWPSALRLANKQRSLNHSYVDLSICPNNAPGKWCLSTNLVDAYVDQKDIEREFAGPGTLRVFRIDEYTLVATDPDDAWELLRRDVGITKADLPGESCEQLPDNLPLRIASEDAPLEAGFPASDGWTKHPTRTSYVWVSERTCSEWVALCGRSILGSHD